MKDRTKRYLSWIAVAVWMTVIFLFSAQTDRQSGDLSGGIVHWFVSLLYQDFDTLSMERQDAILEVWHLLIRKGAHFTEYAVLAMLVANALRFQGKHHWLLPAAVSAAYAVTDEIHQYFVPGRACRLLDVGIDTCGALFGTALFALGIYLFKRRKKPTP